VNLPNIISLSRLIITPIILWLMLTGAFLGAFWLFLAAAVSDALDGAIAKRFDMVTVLGGYLDPIADKTMLVGVFLVLGSLGHLPVWIVLLVVSRDALIIGGALLLWMLERPFWMKPLIVSKVNTVCQIALAVTVLGFLGLSSAHDFIVTLGVMVDILMVVVAVTTLVSGGAYLVMWARRMNHGERGGKT
jgi:cardiolipin synthase